MVYALVHPVLFNDMLRTGYSMIIALLNLSSCVKFTVHAKHLANESLILRTAKLYMYMRSERLGPSLKAYLAAQAS